MPEHVLKGLPPVVGSLVLDGIGSWLVVHSGITGVVMDGLTATTPYGRHVGVDLPSVRVPSSGGAPPMPSAKKLLACRAGR